MKRKPKVVICGSMSFAKKMLWAKEELQKMGFGVFAPPFAGEYARGVRHKDHGKKDLGVKKEIDAINLFYNEIKKADCILVLNYPKNGIDGYIGGNTLIEMGFAYVLKKKIFLINKVGKLGYKSEIMAMDPVVLGGDLEKINKMTKK